MQKPPDTETIMCKIESLLRLADASRGGTKGECANAKAKAELLAKKYGFVGAL